ncbi:hypothetical protein CesoFtcFv8_017177 [Champsocephalus esox]|uniref:Uncharacterized protein n=2 Tax=Champsocephalus esox TaxID=159716 RepID=A0AAN8GQG9_9TELE|nr:hypothetical protein CesoFtcFv8_017177 [Champsocephalus esox]
MFTSLRLDVLLVRLPSIQTPNDLQTTLMKAVWICLHLHHLPRCSHYLLCSTHCLQMYSPSLSSHLVSNKHPSSVYHKLQSNCLLGLFPQDIKSPLLKCMSQLCIPLWCHGLDLLQLAYHIHLFYSNSSTGSSSLQHIQLYLHLLLFGNLLLLRHIQILYRTHGAGLP